MILYYNKCREIKIGIKYIVPVRLHKRFMLDLHLKIEEYLNI